MTDADVAVTVEALLRVSLWVVPAVVAGVWMERAWRA